MTTSDLDSRFGSCGRIDRRVLVGASASCGGLQRAHADQVVGRRGEEKLPIDAGPATMTDILAWTLRTSMGATDVIETLDLARAAAGVDRIPVVHRPRLLSDNGPCYISGALATYLETSGLAHTRSAPYHPMTQGKIERYHRSLKNVVKLDHYYTPWELERALARFVEDYNHRRYHESLQNVTPADMYHGRQATILARRDRIKHRTLQRRKQENLHGPHLAAIRSEVSLRKSSEQSQLL